MKTLNRLFPVIMAVTYVMCLASCENKINQSGLKGTAEFSVALQGSNGTKSGSDSVIVSYQVLISVQDQAGNTVFTDKTVPLYVFGNGFVSESVEIEAGDYKLTKFMVINVSGEVIYAAPLEGSSLAYLTDKPLPLNFSILPGKITTVLPEVLSVGDQTPDKFGYASFSVKVIKPLEFYAECILDPGNPMIMAPTQITTADLTVYDAYGWHYKFKLEAGVNHLIIRGGSDIYTFVLEKEGYLTQELQLTANNLLATTKENPLILKIPWGSQNKVIVLQPGPEKGKDAMISNLDPDKNFGDYKYFEATFLSEPVLTVMRSNRSLIAFNLDTLPKSAIIKQVILTLSYDIPIPFDSIYYLTNTGPAAGVVWYGAVLQQIVEPWDEFKVTWNNQPKTIETNQVYIPPFIRNVNFIDVDVTKLFVSPSAIASAVYANYGMLFRLWPVDKFPGFRFGSSDYPDAKLRPKLTIYFTLN